MDPIHVLAHMPSSSLHLSSSHHFRDRLLAPSLSCQPLRIGFPVVARFGAQIGPRSVEKSQFSTVNLPSSSARRQHLMQVQAAKKTFSSFDDLLKNSETAVLVDFYATWCGPCQFMVPVLDDVGRALKDRVRVVKIDSEKYPSIANRYNVQALPTLVLFENGEPIDRLEGAMTAPDLIKRIEGVLSSSKAKARD